MRTHAIRPATVRRAKAFTLVEVIVAMGVTAILLTGMLTIVSQASGVWERSTGVLTTRAEADLIFDRLSQDLNAAVLQRDGNVWLAATIQPSPQTATGDAAMVDAIWSGRVKPTSDSPGAAGSSLDLAPASARWRDFRFGQAGMWLRLFTVQADTQTTLSNLSAVRAVSYQLVRRRVTASASAASPAEAPIRYVLYRSSARPMSPSWPDLNSTFALGYDIFAPAHGLGYNLSDSSQIDNVGNIRTPRRYEQIIGNNVIDFGLRFWVRDASGELVVRYPVEVPSAAAQTTYGFAATLRDGIWRERAVPPQEASSVVLEPSAMTYGFPERIDAFVRILTEEGAVTIAAFERGRIQRPAGTLDDADAWWDLATRHSHVFTTQIPVYSQPL